MNRKILAFETLTAAIIAAVLLPSGCYYDNEVEQYGVTICDTVAMSYSQDIQPIIQSNCLSCHAPGGEQESTPFTNYTEIKPYSDANNILARIKGVGGIMPPTGAISTCNQLKIEAWINAGAQDN